VAASDSSTYLALLRGINVGGKRKVPMDALSRVFSEAGAGSVRTYIQSGNVVFSSIPEDPSALAARLSAMIGERFGFPVPVVLRSRDEIARMVQENPYIEEGADPDTLHVLFLADLPRPDLVRALDGFRSPPDAFLVQGREVFLRLPDGVARTKLTNAFFDAGLKTVGTMRNWRTVLRLRELTEAGRG
jgi:uncharacterized protein (DUF1697 family)